MGGDGRTQLALYGLFGVGNLGNEASLDAVLTQLRHMDPTLDVVCLCWASEETSKRHRVSATPLTAVAGFRPNGRWSIASKAFGRVLDLPRTLRLVGQVDAVAVPGMGVLEEQIGVRPWGLPYWLFVLAVSCRLRSRPLFLVSIGVDESTNRLTRRLFRWVLRLAEYRTYRDDYSLHCAQALGGCAPSDRVVPDVAFALEAPPSTVPRVGTVALGVMTYYGPEDDPIAGRQVYAEYIRSIVALSEGLLLDGRDIKLVVGDRVDLQTAQLLLRIVRQRNPDLQPGRLCVSDVDDLSGLMQEMAASEAVIASRYHNIITSLIVGRPTVSIGYAKKNAEVMRSVGLGAYCHEIGSLDPILLLASLREVERGWAQMGPVVAASVGRLRRDTRAQIDLLHAGLNRSARVV